MLVLVEDEDAIVRPLTSALEREGYVVLRFASAEDALPVIRESRPRMVILDLGLPGMSGLDALRDLRSDSEVPVLILTARGLEEDRVAGLEAGADDYLPKPFGSAELVARVRAILRRVSRPAPARTLRIGDLEVDPTRREVRRGGERVSLTAREFDLLACLAARSPATVSRRQLMTEVWDTHWSGSTKTLDVHMAQLRRKVEPDPARPRNLHTVRGVGYAARFACADG